MKDDVFHDVKFESFPKTSVEPKQEAVLCSEIGDGDRVDGNILPAI